MEWPRELRNGRGGHIFNLADHRVQLIAPNMGLSLSENYNRARGAGTGTGGAADSAK